MFACPVRRAEGTVWACLRNNRGGLFVVPDTGVGEPESWEQVTSLLLVLEATSPSTARADRTRKLKIYRDERIPEYWILDVDGHVVERWRPNDERPEILAATLEWQPNPGVEPLTIDVPDLFVTRKSKG